MAYFIAGDDDMAPRTIEIVCPECKALSELNRRSAERHPVAGYIDSKGSESA